MAKLNRVLDDVPQLAGRKRNRLQHSYSDELNASS
jgi:hypothetical protein